MVIDKMMRRTVFRIFIYLGFAALWTLTIALGIKNLYHLPTPSTLMASLGFIAGNLVFACIAYHYHFYEILIFLIIFWAVGALGLFLCDITGISAFALGLGVSLFPVLIGFDFDPQKVKTMQDLIHCLIIYTSYLGIPILCGVFLFLLNRKDKKQQVEQ